MNNMHYRLTSVVGVSLVPIVLTFGFLLFFLINPQVAFAQGAPCPSSPSTTVYEGSLRQGDSIRLPINLAPCETVSITATVIPVSQRLGVDFSLTFYNSAGRNILSKLWGTYDQVTVTFPSAAPYHGTRGIECLPVYAIFKDEIWDIYFYSITVKKVPRPGYNIGGTSFNDAPTIGPLPATYYGSLCGCEPLYRWDDPCPTESGQFFRIRLRGNQAIYLSGSAEGNPAYGGGMVIEIYDSSQNYIRNLVNAAAYGVIQYTSGPFTNSSPNPQDFYLRIKPSSWRLYDFKMVVQDFNNQTDLNIAKRLSQNSKRPPYVVVTKFA